MCEYLKLKIENSNLKSLYEMFGLNLKFWKLKCLKLKTEMSEYWKLKCLNVEKLKCLNVEN